MHIGAEAETKGRLTQTATSATGGAAAISKTYAMLGVGLDLMGWGGRRRKQKVAAAAWLYW